MHIFDLAKAAAFPYEQREKNVFYETGEFKTRIIGLPPGGQIPACEMASHVIFYVLEGTVKVTVNSETAVIREKQCLIIEPSTVSMTTERGAKLMGIQIKRKG
jgi:mannose-6-phosphate isomerase-like protein (cupin superfamily)